MEDLLAQVERSLERSRGQLDKVVARSTTRAKLDFAYWKGVISAYESVRDTLLRKIQES